jgi:hypothetical protein
VLNFNIFFASLKYFEIKIQQIVAESTIEESVFTNMHRINIESYAKGLWNEMIENKDDEHVSLVRFVRFMYPHVYHSLGDLKKRDKCGDASDEVKMLEDRDTTPTIEDKIMKLKEINSEICHRLIVRLLEKVEAEKLTKVKRAWEIDETAECKFNPEINTADSVNSAAHIRRRIEKEGVDESFDLSKLSKPIDQMKPYELLWVDGAVTNKKVKKMREELIANELKECTFKPTVTPLSKKVTQFTTVPNVEIGDVGQRLYAYMMPKAEKDRKAVEESSEMREVKKHCTFAPQFHSKSFFDKQGVKPQSIPNGYQKKLEQMQIALNARKANLELLAQLDLRSGAGLKPPTPIESGDPAKKKKFLVPPRKSNRLILNLNVNLDDGAVGNLKVREQDDPKALANAFASKYKITSEMKSELEGIIATQISNYRLEKRKGKGGDDRKRTESEASIDDGALGDVNSHAAATPDVDGEGEGEGEGETRTEEERAEERNTLQNEINLLEDGIRRLKEEKEEEEVDDEGHSKKVESS